MKNAVLEIIKKEKPLLVKEFGVKEIALFGSYARGNAGKDSDVDILVTLTKPEYSVLAGLLIYLEEKLNKKVDLIRTGPHLTERFFKIIGKDIIYA
jgi:predicted nucleotidyltransferase